MNSQKKKPSEGEEFIKDFLDSERIRYIHEKRIENLKGDTASFRDADFYLTDYKVYIEFFGQWNSGEEHRNRYRAKKSIYSTNKIPCVYLYAENLGIIDYIFHKRLTTELIKHNLKHELIRWRLINSFKEARDYVWLFLICITCFIASLIPPLNTKAIVIFFLFSLILSVIIVVKSKRIWK